MRMTGVCRNFFGNGSNILAHKLNLCDNQRQTMTYLNFGIAAIAIPIFFDSHLRTKNTKYFQRQATTLNFRDAMKKIILSKYSVFKFFSSMQGVHKNAMSNYKVYIVGSLLPNT